MSFTTRSGRSSCLKSLLVVCMVLQASFAMALSVPQVSLTEAAKKLSGGGYVLLLRHAETEGGSVDSPSFKLSDCKTQLKLSAAGRAYASRIAEAFKSAGIQVSDVASSEFCRSKETAQLAFGKSTEWPALSFFLPHLKRAEAKQTGELKGVLSHMKAPKNVAWVTHQPNITALTGYVPSATEVLAVRSVAGKPVIEFRFSPAP
jgi:phosphohistidine phosphatase SixA